LDLCPGRCIEEGFEMLSLEMIQRGHQDGEHTVYGNDYLHSSFLRNFGLSARLDRRWAGAAEAQQALLGEQSDTAIIQKEGGLLGQHPWV